jgi:hypothetical protein
LLRKEEQSALATSIRFTPLGGRAGPDATYKSLISIRDASIMFPLTALAQASGRRSFGGRAFVNGVKNVRATRKELGCIVGSSRLSRSKMSDDNTINE